MTVSCVLISAAGGSYALPMADVAEVIPLGTITRVPGLPAWLPGLTGWRGRLLAVADLTQLVGDTEKAAVIVVLRRGELELGLSCKEVSGTLEIDVEDLARTPSVVPSAVAALLVGHVVAAGSSVGLLDTGALLALRDRLPSRDGQRLNA